MRYLQQSGRCSRRGRRSWRDLEPADLDLERPRRRWDWEDEDEDWVSDLDEEDPLENFWNYENDDSEEPR